MPLISLALNVCIARSPVCAVFGKEVLLCFPTGCSASGLRDLSTAARRVMKILFRKHTSHVQRIVTHTTCVFLEDIEQENTEPPD